METIIEAKRLSCIAGHRYLLKDIDWTVKKGEHWAVFGMNGSGKTTLLSIIAGYKPATSGELKVFGHVFDAENIMHSRSRIGWVSSSFYDRYYSRESVMEIVLASKFGSLGIRGDITDADIKQAKGLLGKLGIIDKRNQAFRTMSKGERQNVLIARALMAKPDILVLDEPCAGLDILAREHLLDMIRQFARTTDMTIIYVTHYPEEIIDVFSQALLLKNGRCVGQGKREDIFCEDILGEFLEQPVELLPQERGQFRVRVKATAEPGEGDCYV